jgi:predicted dehydrogenase
MTSLGVGVVGCGTISRVYLRNGPRLDGLHFVACTDAVAEAAERTAADHGLDACATTQDLLDHPGVEVVLCLTPPDWHAEIALQAIAASRHVYTEKPLATSVEGAREVLAAAQTAGVKVGCAPDTFLGAGIQTLRAAIDDGAIGTPALAQLRLLGRPPETWHPAPAFLYAELAGPLLDIGPYGVATAVELVGPVRRVTGIGRRARDTGVIAVGPLAGTTFPIAEPTRVSAVLEHASGVLTTLTTSFDVDGPARHGVEVQGSDGTLLGGDPNGFDGPAILRRRGQEDEPLPLVSEWRDNARGLGLQDLCRAITEGTPQRASGARGLHVVEVLLGIRESVSAGRPTEIAGHGTRYSGET